MRWRRVLGLPRHKPDPEAEARLDRAEERAENVRERGERVALSLEGRLRRNHWGETVAQIARRGRP